MKYIITENQFKKFFGKFFPKKQEENPSELSSDEESPKKEFDKVNDIYAKELFNDLYEVKYKENNSSKRFWKIDDEIVLQLEPSGMMWISEIYWNMFSNLSSLKYNDTQMFLNDWLENKLGLRNISVVPNNIESAPTWKSSIFKNMVKL